jgi:hypothetical protein
MTDFPALCLHVDRMISSVSVLIPPKSMFPNLPLRNLR